MADTTKIWEKHFGNLAAVGLSESEKFFEELNQEILKEQYEQQTKKRFENPVQSVTEIPKTVIDWHEGKYHIFYFTGKFRKVRRGEFNRRIAERNRKLLFCYQPEFEFDGEKFPLNVCSFRPDEIPENLKIN